MGLPELVRSELDGESVTARVALGGEDELLVTPTRTLVYRADGLLSDEAVETYPHDAERIEVSEGKRKSKVSLGYGLDGERSFAVPTKRLREALHPVLAGALAAVGIVEDGETVTHVFRFSELTLVITDSRVVKHIGAAVWDDDYEVFRYDDVTDLAFEDGSVATSVVLTLGDRQERFKAPNEEARAVREGLESALLAYHGVGSLSEFRAAVSADERGDEDASADERGSGGSARSAVDFGDGPDPLSATPSQLARSSESAPRAADGRADPPNAEPRHADTAADGAGADGAAADEFRGTGFEPADAGSDEELASRLAALEGAVERQNEALREQRELVEQLIEELRRGR
ncbi:DUF7115 domain-containing protein [Halegenticoccus soli]|uniref:DUF7115 domain-containing protein n=1 Tax=Halegenticoccus soli TaxID=1985678 RepID=UPI000C6D73A1|nr:hypothetical protein [Halegenticoccus soli]